MKKNGRPLVVLTDEQNYKIEALAAVLTQEQIADYLGIGRTTFYEIMKRDPKVLEHYKIITAQMPKMLVKDPVSRYYGLKRGTIVKIIRTSPSSGEYITYRYVR